MLCSICNKNTAVIFINKVENGKTTNEGLCFNCAKERGINPLDVLIKNSNINPEEIEDLSNQFDEMMQNISDNPNIDSEFLNSGAGNPFTGFMNMFKNQSNNQVDNDNEESSSQGRTKKSSKSK